MYLKYNECFGNYDVSIWKGLIKVEDLKYIKSRVGVFLKFVCYIILVRNICNFNMNYLNIYLNE